MRLPLFRGLCLVLLLLAGGLGLLHSEPSKDGSAEQITRLIQQLGHDDFARREEASRGLEAVGEKALPALRQASATAADAEIRRRAREAVQDILLQVRKSKSTGLETVVVDQGEFQMGSSNTEYGRRADETLHEVRISRTFLLGAYEVTQEEFEKVMKHNPSWFSATGEGKNKVGKDTGRFPVEKVTWFDAIAFCNALSKLDGYEPYYKLANEKYEGKRLTSATVTIAGGNGYRLPTEAEWEFACRAGTKTPFFYRNGNTGREANLKPSASSGGYGGPPTWQALERTAKVGSYAANSLGLYDMHGNVAEWCWDWYDKDYYSNSPAADPKGPDKGDHRVYRGGSWLVAEGSCRSASRNWYAPNDNIYSTGFRVARTP